MGMLRLRNVCLLERRSVEASVRQFAGVSMGMHLSVSASILARAQERRARASPGSVLSITHTQAGATPHRALVPAPRAHLLESSTIPQECTPSQVLVGAVRTCY